MKQSFFHLLTILFSLGIWVASSCQAETPRQPSSGIPTADRSPWNSRHSYRPPRGQERNPRGRPAYPTQTPNQWMPPAYAYPPGAPGAPSAIPNTQRPAQHFPTPGATAPAQHLEPKITLQSEFGSRLLYVQQSTVLTLLITSNVPLKTVTPELRNLDNAIYKKLDGPDTVMDGKDSVTRFRYAFTPLMEGQMLMPPASISGETASGTHYAIEAESPILLTVIPMSEGPENWLPLQGLTFRTNLERPNQLAIGKPLTLTTILEAVGATGAQLPSLEDQLRDTPDFKVYRERVDANGHISGDGNFLLGQRKEVYTLIPTHGGKARIPGLSITWWNVVSGDQETSNVPIRQLVIDGPDFDPTSTRSGAFANGMLLWAPLIVILLLTGGFWTLSWLQHKPFFALVTEEFRIGLVSGSRALRRLLVLLSPMRRMRRLRRRLLGIMPVSWRVTYCMRKFQDKETPIEWSCRVRGLLRSNLSLGASGSMLSAGREIQQALGIAPNARIDQLMTELDLHLYNRLDAMDFNRWKRELATVLRRARKTSAKRRDPRPKLLPPLNPSETAS